MVQCQFGEQVTSRVVDRDGSSCEERRCEAGENVRSLGCGERLVRGMRGNGERIRQSG